jgi:hypothetical protein
LKKCSRCKRDKSLSEFYISRTNSSGYQSRCKDCDKEKRKLAYWSDLDNEKTKSKRWRDKNNKSLSVDHCHATDRIRGLLCLDCNFLIAHAKDNIEILLSAIKYLEKNGNSKYIN